MPKLTGSTSGAGSSASFALPGFASNIFDLIVVFVAVPFFSGAIPTVSVSDSAGNTYSLERLDGASYIGTEIEVYVFIATQVATQSNLVITVTQNSGITAAAVAASISGAGQGMGVEVGGLGLEYGATTNFTSAFSALPNVTTLPLFVALSGGGPPLAASGSPGTLVATQAVTTTFPLSLQVLMGMFANLGGGVYGYNPFTLKLSGGAVFNIAGVQYVVSAYVVIVGAGIQGASENLAKANNTVVQTGVTNLLQPNLTPTPSGAFNAVPPV